MYLGSARFEFGRPCQWTNFPKPHETDHFGVFSSTHVQIKGFQLLLQKNGQKQLKNTINKQNYITLCC